MSIEIHMVMCKDGGDSLFKERSKKLLTISTNVEPKNNQNHAVLVVKPWEAVCWFKILIELTWMVEMQLFI